MRAALLVFFLLMPSFAGAADRPFIMVSTALVASTIYDAETTYAGYNDRHPGVHEANPIARPFVKAGRPALYGFELGADAAVLYAAYRMKNSDSPTWRKVWWILPVTVTVGHVAAGTANLRFVF